MTDRDGWTYSHQTDDYRAWRKGDAEIREDRQTGMYQAVASDGWVCIHTSFSAAAQYLES